MNLSKKVICGVRNSLVDFLSYIYTLSGNLFSKLARMVRKKEHFPNQYLLPAGTPDALCRDCGPYDRYSVPVRIRKHSAGAFR